MHRKELYGARERCSVNPMMLDAPAAASLFPLSIDKHNCSIISNACNIECCSTKTENEKADIRGQGGSHGQTAARKRRLHSQVGCLVN